MADAAEPEERPAREDRGRGGARRICLVHSDKLLETSEKNPRFAGRVSLRDSTRDVSRKLLQLIAFTCAGKAGAFSD